MDLDNMTTEQFVAEAKRMRAEADAAEERLMEFLYEAEKRPELWEGSGKTFLQFIESHGICRAARYHGWKRTWESCDHEQVKSAGVNAAVAAGGLPEPSDRSEVLGQSLKFRETNGTPPSDQSARAMARDVKQRRAAVSTRNKGYLELHRENEKLRAENARLREENKNLKAELKQAKKRNAA